jgi:hypothetical protein
VTSATRAWSTPASPPASSRFLPQDGRFVVRTDGRDGVLADHPVRYTFGVDPLQQCLVELPGGRLQALGLAWDTRPKARGGQRWIHLYPGQNVSHDHPLHWTAVRATALELLGR